jgi:DNA-binding NarL/FixJ family response regulator
MTTNTRTDSLADPAEPTESAIVVSPVVVVTQSFDARPSSLPDASMFVRSALAGATIDEADLRAVNTAIVDALLIAASPSIGTFQVVVRLFPDDVEIEVLSSTDSQPPRAPATTETTSASFAQWFSDVLRRQGLSQEAAARQLGVSVRTVSRWVRGQTEPRLRDVRRISGAFGPVPHRHS